MTSARRKTLLRMRQLATKTATLSALSMQVLGCDPMTPPAREPPPNVDNDAGVTTPTPPTKPDGG